MMAADTCLDPERLSSTRRAVDIDWHKMARISKFFPTVIAAHVARSVRLLRRKLETERNRRRTPAQVFASIYRRNRWGGAPGEYDSGDGTRNEALVAAYLAAVRHVLDEPMNPPLPRDCTFVDLGCGDFRVGKALLPLCAKYIGVDVVAPLVQRNRERFGTGNVSFHCADIIEAPLPSGDVCFLRQVLQHLSNDQVKQILSKLGQYRLVLITEHHPSGSRLVKPNLDKVHGAGIRTSQNSGIYLTEPPFSLPEECVEQILEVPWRGPWEDSPVEFIRTFAYRPKPTAQSEGKRSLPSQVASS